MFGCCAFIPLGFVLIVAPIMAAGRGWRAFLYTAIIEAVMLLLLAIAELQATFELGSSREYGGMVLMGVTMFVVLPLILGGLVLYAKHAEGELRGKVCRVCGYDLRASPDRCPECGTPVNFDPDQF